MPQSAAQPDSRTRLHAPEATHPDVTITAVRATPVNLPLVAPYRWASGLYHGSTKVIVQVSTAGGLTGLGEASNWRHAATIQDTLAPRLVGQSALDIHHCWKLAVPPAHTVNNTETSDIVRAFGAIEIALWDLRAQYAELPLYELLGGKWRDEVPFTEYFAPRLATEYGGGEASADDIGQYCARMVQEHGSPDFEGKVGYSDVATDRAIVEAVREAIGPTRSLALDANMGWTIGTARDLLADLAGCRLRQVEDPVATYEDMARLRQSTSIPFSTHVADVARAVALGVPNSFALNLTSYGGLIRTRRLIAACEMLGVGFTFYSGESGVGTAAYLHLAAAEPYLGQPSQSLLRWYQRDVVKGGPWSPEAGVLPVPRGTGLGIELDMGQVEIAHREYVEQGPIETLVPSMNEEEYPQLPLY